VATHLPFAWASAQLLLVDHDKKKAVDALQTNPKKEQTLSEEVRMLMMTPVNKNQLHTDDMQFKRVQGWFGHDRSEKVDGWKTDVYEATAKLTANLVRGRGTSERAGSSESRAGSLAVCLRRLYHRATEALGSFRVVDTLSPLAPQIQKHKFKSTENPSCVLRWCGARRTRCAARSRCTLQRRRRATTCYPWI
jgi:hypothetical protein